MNQFDENMMQEKRQYQNNNSRWNLLNIDM